jgi:hypothetical protein
METLSLITSSKLSESDDGVCFSISVGAKEIIQVQVPYLDENGIQSGPSVWWEASISPNILRDWILETMDNMKNTSLECQIEIWVGTEGTNNPLLINKRYRISEVEQIVKDTQDWANDAVVGCFITDIAKNRVVIYMWAELNTPNESPHPYGEVGFKCDIKVLDPIKGKLMFSKLFEGTTLHNLTKDEIEQVYGIILDNIVEYTHP